MTMQTLRTTPLAIVGMACRFPGADDLDEFWQLLVEGRSGLCELPPERLDPELRYHPERGKIGRTYSKLGGMVPLRPVDRELLPLSDEVIASIDPIQLAMCETAAKALRHAGYDPFALPSARSGVFVGTISGTTDLSCRMGYSTLAPHMAAYLNDVEAFQALPPELRDEVMQSIVHSIRADYPKRTESPIRDVTPGAAAGTIANLFGANGPAFIVDAACASSLVALRMAALNLQFGKIDMAIVASGGYRKWLELVMIAQAGTPSPTGCRPFDATSDGIVCTDGFAAIIVKTLDRAIADGDRICGVVRSIGTSSDGRGRAFWAPRKEGQVAAIQRAYEDGFDASRVQFVEAHATSTQLGDATEVAALAEAFGGKLRERIPIGSVKANVGHTLEVAGLAGLIKTLLAMEHGIVPPAVGYEQSNPDIEWEQTPFYLPTTPVEWPEPTDGGSRCAGVDSFGIGGINVHLVVEQKPSPAESTHSNGAADTNGHSKNGHSAKAKNGVARNGHAANGSAISKASSEPIAVIGLGGLFPNASALDEFEAILKSGESQRRRISVERWDTSLGMGADAGPFFSPEECRAALIENYAFDWKKHKIAPKQVATINPLHCMLVDAADRALTDAFGEVREFDRSRVGTVVGSIFSNDYESDTWIGVWVPEFQQRLMRELAARGLEENQVAEIVERYGQTTWNKKPAAGDESGSCAASTMASRIAKHFDLFGEAFSLDAGEASGLAALACSVDLLRTGACDTVVCAAVNRRANLTVFEEAWCGTDRNLVRNADGEFVPPADAVAIVVLRRLADAECDGNRIRAVLRDVSCAVDDGASSCASNATNTQLAAQFGDFGGASGLAALFKETIELQNGTGPERTEICSLRRPVIEGKAAAMWRATIESPTAVSKEVTVPVGSIEQQVFEFVEERTGYPRNVIDLDQRLPSDWWNNPRRAASLARTLMSRCGFATESGPSDADLAALATPRQIVQLLESLAGRTQTEPVQAVAQPAGPSALHPPASQVTDQVLLRTIEWPLPADCPDAPVLNGPVVVYGDEAVAQALCEKLVAVGATVYLLPAEAPVDETLASFDALLEQTVCPHLCVVAARHDEETLACASGSVAVAVCRRWYERVVGVNLLDSASLVALTSLGGDFGISGHAENAESSLLIEFVRAVAAEAQRPALVKIVDSPVREPAKLAATSIVKEWASNTPEIEVGYIRGRRFIVCALPELKGEFPLIDCVAQESETSGTAFAVFDPTRDPFLTGHRAQGIPLLPVVVCLETCSEAAIALHGGTVLQIKDVKLINGFRMATPIPHHARVKVTFQNDEAHCELIGEFRDRDGHLTDPLRTFMSCVVVLGPERPPLPPLELGEPADGWHDASYPDDWHDMGGASSGTVYYGPALQTLRQFVNSEDRTWSRMLGTALSDLGGERTGDRWQTPPALFDGMLFTCDLYGTHQLGTWQLPIGFDNIRYGRLPRPGEQCKSIAFFKGHNGRQITFDCATVGDDGEAIIICEGCHVATVEQPIAAK